MNAVTLNLDSLTRLAPLRSVRRHVPRPRPGTVTTGLIVLAAVLSFVGSVAWAQGSADTAPPAQATAKPAPSAPRSARASAGLAGTPKPGARPGTTSTPAPWARPEPAVLCACVRDKTRA